MIFVPLPFIVSLLLAVILVQMLRRNDETVGDNPFFVLLIAAYGLQSILLGLRWGYDLRAVLWLQMMLAAIIPSLAWLSFGGLAQETGSRRRIWQWLHALPALLVACLIAFWREPIGLVLIATFAGYGIALLVLARAGPDALVAARLDGAVRSYLSLRITAFAMLASALSDIVISFDFLWSGGRYSGAVVAVGNVLALLILGGAASVASSGQSAPSGDAEDTAVQSQPKPAATQEDADVAASIESLMVRKALYRDVDLNLGRLARKLALPARQVSLAINRVHGMSVSQYVNDHRIREACRLLETTEDPVTKIMFDAGFLSKSNFNREFLRLTGTSPKGWRQAKAGVRGEKWYPTDGGSTATV